jgi:catechol 2,3-dioxygenase-like lactoylglutathione lyase family enzyme
MKRMLFCLLGTLTLGCLSAVAQTQLVPANPGVVKLRYVTILVRDYDEALAWYTGVLGLKKVEDKAYGAGHRWLVVAPEGQSEPGIVLDVPEANISASDRMGKETDWVFTVSDCTTFYKTLSTRGVHFIETPKRQPWGEIQAIFEDPYGNIFVAESPAAAGSAQQPGGK